MSDGVLPALFVLSVVRVVFYDVLVDALLKAKFENKLFKSFEILNYLYF